LVSRPDLLHTEPQFTAYRFHVRLLCKIKHSRNYEPDVATAPAKTMAMTTIRLELMVVIFH
jgi:hypothetical protein